MPLKKTSFKIAFFIALLYGSVSYAQSENLNQLLSTVNSNDPLIEKLKAYQKIIEHYKYENIDSSYLYAQEGIQFFKEENYIHGEIKLKTQDAFLSIYEGQWNKAKDYYNQIVELSLDNDSLELELLYGNLSLCHENLGQMDSALVYLYKAIEIGPKGNADRFYRNYYLLGDLYMHEGRYDEAEANFLIVYNQKENTSKLTHYVTLFYLSQLYALHKKDYVKMVAIQKEAIELKNEIGIEENDNFHFEDIGLESLPFVQQEEILLSALKENKVIDYKTGMRVSLMLLLKLYSENNMPEKSDNIIQPYLEKNWIESGSLKTQSEWFALLQKHYAQKGNFQQAYLFSTKHQKSNDSLKTLNDQKLIFELNEKYQSALKDGKIVRQKNEIAKKTDQRNLLLLSALLLAAIGLMIFNRIRQKQKLTTQENLIQHQKIEQLEKEKKILSLAAMLEGQESERIRIAKDLHDGLGGLLGTVKAHFGKIQKEIKALENIQIYDKANGMIDKACDEVRRISHNLMPGPLRANGLANSIQHLANNLEEAHGLDVTCEILGPEVKLEETSEVFIYRIYQELCNNITKHAEAKKVLVQLIRTDEEIHILVEDDGKGFDLDSAMKKEGIGLNSLISRINFLNGKYEIDSRVGEGTTITINIPIK